MTDIVERLRYTAQIRAQHRSDTDPIKLKCLEAADEIEKLRRTLMRFDAGYDVYAEAREEYRKKIAEQAAEIERLRNDLRLAIMSDSEECKVLTEEVERLRAGGCARDQGLTQHCAEAAAMAEENERIRAANRDVMLHWEVLKADHDRLRAALHHIAWEQKEDDPTASDRPRRAGGEGGRMIDKNKQYRTRDGREVRIYAVDGGANGNAIHAAYKTEMGWVSDQWFPDGKYTHCGVHMKDLIEVRPRIQREVWVNVYRHPDGYEFVDVAFNKSELDAVGDARIACVRLTIDCEEGEGL